ncbi:MAG: trigger factor [Oscillospiraceae bacterium]|nr:trigger factor [Oscillospiraceae bacterium]MBQ5323972.1 trigger factor [Oscillospiraceae bacterium]
MELIRNEKVADNTVELEFKVSAEVFADAVTKAFKKANKDITVPGFRKGKAPRNVVEKMYGAEVFFNDAIDAILPDAYADAVEAAGIEPVARPEVDIKVCSKEEGFVAVAKVVVKPEVKVNEYKGLKATRKSAVVEDAAVEAELNTLRERNGRLVEVEGRKAELNDTANIDFEGFVDEVAFEGGKGEGFDLLLGSGQFIPGFEEQIVGHEIGEEFDVNVTFPEEYHATELAGKAAVFKTKLNSLKVKELPELDDEFAKDVSEFDTLDELKADIRKAKEERAAQEAELEVENSLVDAVVASMEAIIPEEMTENRIDELVRDFEGRMAQQGLQLATYLQYTGMEMESFRKTFREQAEQQVKIRLALEKVAEMENLTASDEEVEAELAKIAEAYKMKLEQVKAFIPAVEIRKDLVINKAIDFIKENAEITAE